LRLSYNGSRLTTAGLYSFEQTQLAGNGLFGQPLTALYTAQLPDNGQTSTLQLEINVQDTVFNVRSNGVNLFSTSFNRPLSGGAVGLQLSSGTIVNNVAIYE
jgi:hypothetical protein